MAGFENLEVWRRAVDMCADVYRQLANIKDYGFRDQITRSALSIASNIAEGSERSSIPDRAKFLEYAKASCGEFRTQAIIGIKAGILEETIANPWIEESREISCMIHGLIQSHRSKSK